MTRLTVLRSIATAVTLFAVVASCAKIDLNLALLKAAEQGTVQQVKSLLTRGASVDARDSFERTPLMLSAVSGHAEIAAVLLEAGADVRAAAKYGQTALQFAVERGDGVIAGMLKSAGADR